MEETTYGLVKDESQSCECGSDRIMHDMFEDEEIHWCPHCGRQVIYETDEVTE